MTEQKKEPEAISREFNKAMQEAGELYARKSYEAPELDPELLKQFKRRQKKSAHKRMTQIAAIFMVAVVGGVSVGVWANADGAYGGKKFIRKCVNIISPLDIEQEMTEDGRLTETATITDEKKIKDAERFAEQLYVPEYIPEGYSFEYLKINKDDDFVSQDYLYKKDEEQFMVSVNINRSGVDTDTIINGSLYKSPRTGEEMYVATYEGKEYSVTRIRDRANSIVNGIGNVKEGIKVMENFKPIT